MRRMSFLATLQDQAYAAPRSPFKPRAEPPSFLIFTYHITTHNLFLHNKLIKYFTRLDPLNKISATPYFSSRRKLTELSMHECHKKSVSLKRKMKIKRILFCFHLTPFQTKKKLSTYLRRTFAASETQRLPPYVYQAVLHKKII